MKEVQYYPAEKESKLTLRVSFSIKMKTKNKPTCYIGSLFLHFIN